jgi:hypothetical protein
MCSDIESQYYLLRFIFKIWVPPAVQSTATVTVLVILIVAKSVKFWCRDHKKIRIEKPGLPDPDRK